MTTALYQTRTRTLAGAFASLLVLVFVFAGLPTALYLMAGPPLHLPIRLPSPDEVQQALRNLPYDPLLLTATLRVIGWVTWGLYVLVTLHEALAQLRGRRPRRVRGIGWLQQLAARTLTGLTVAVTTTAPLAQASATQVAATATAHPDPKPLPPVPRQNSHGGHANPAAQRHLLVHLPFDTARLDAHARHVIDAVARAIRAHADPHRPVVIEGHTDSKGSAAYNHALSLRRAQAVHRALRDILGDTYRLHVVAKGEAEPLAANTRPDGRDDPVGRARNRRVDITYTVEAPRLATPCRPEPAARAPAPVDGPPQGPPPASPNAADTPVERPSAVIELPSGGVVGISFAAGVSAAIAAARLRRRYRSAARSSAPSDLSGEPRLTPALRHIREADLAQLAATHRGGEGDRTAGKSSPDIVAQRPHGAFPAPSDSSRATAGIAGEPWLRAPAGVAASAVAESDRPYLAPGGRVVLGVKPNGEEANVVTSGLAVWVSGPGAEGFTRALLTGLLSEESMSWLHLVVPADDLSQLLGAPVEPARVEGRPTLVVPATMEDAIIYLSAELARRARVEEAVQTALDLGHEPGQIDAHPPLILLATAPDHRVARQLAGIFDQADSYDMGAFVLDEGPFSTGWHIDGDGTITKAVSYSNGDEYAGVRVATTDDTARAVELVAACLAQPAAAPLASEPSPPAGVADAATTSVRPRLLVLGPFAISVDGREIPGLLRRRPATELATYLACHPHGVFQDTAIEELWPDLPLKSARKRFSEAVYHLRTALRKVSGDQTGEFIIHPIGSYRLDPEQVEVDLWQFTAALDDARHATDDAAKLAHLERATALYRGELAHIGEGEWADRRQQDLRAQTVQALLRIAELREPTNPDAALAALERAAALDPYREEPCRRVMTLNAKLGRLDAVQACYDLHAARLAEIDAQPSPELAELLSALLSGATPPFAAR